MDAGAAPFSPGRRAGGSGARSWRAGSPSWPRREGAARAGGGGERARHRRAPRVPSARARPLREGAALTVLYQRPNALCLKPFPAIRAKPAPTQLRAVCLTPVPAHQSACPSSAAAEDAEVSPQPPAPGQCPQPASHGFPGRPLSTSKAQYLFHIVVPKTAPTERPHQVCTSAVRGAKGTKAAGVSGKPSGI